MVTVLDESGGDNKRRRENTSARGFVVKTDVAGHDRTSEFFAGEGKAFHALCEFVEDLRRLRGGEVKTVGHSERVRSRKPYDTQRHRHGFGRSGKRISPALIRFRLHRKHARALCLRHLDRGRRTSRSRYRVKLNHGIILLPYSVFAPAVVAGYKRNKI